MQFKSSFNFGYFCFLSQQRDQTIDILVMVLYNLCIFEEGLLLLGSTGFMLQKGSRELTEDVSILAHDDAGLYVFLFLFWLH